MKFSVVGWLDFLSKIYLYHNNWVYRILSGANLKENLFTLKKWQQ